MRLVSLLLLLWGATADLGAASDLFAADVAVAQLTAATHAAWRRANPVALVLYYTPGCSECPALAPVWAAAAAESRRRRLPPLAAVNCQPHPAVCDSVDAPGDLPAVRLHGPAGGEAGEQYGGPWEVPALLAFLEDRGRPHDRGPAGWRRRAPLLGLAGGIGSLGVLYALLRRRRQGGGAVGDELAARRRAIVERCQTLQKEAEAVQQRRQGRRRSGGAAVAGDGAAGGGVPRLCGSDAAAEAARPAPEKGPLALGVRRPAGNSPTSALPAVGAPTAAAAAAAAERRLIQPQAEVSAATAAATASPVVLTGAAPPQRAAAPPLTATPTVQPAVGQPASPKTHAQSGQDAVDSAAGGGPSGSMLEAPHPPPAAEAPSAGNRLPAPPPRMAPAAAVPLVGSPATEELRSLLHDHQVSLAQHLVQEAATALGTQPVVDLGPLLDVVARVLQNVCDHPSQPRYHRVNLQATPMAAAWRVPLGASPVPCRGWIAPTTRPLSLAAVFAESGRSGLGNPTFRLAFVPQSRRNRSPSPNRSAGGHSGDFQRRCPIMKAEEGEAHARYAGSIVALQTMLPVLLQGLQSIEESSIRQGVATEPLMHFSFEHHCHHCRHAIRDQVLYHDSWTHGATWAGMEEQALEDRYDCAACHTTLCESCHRRYQAGSRTVHPAGHHFTRVGPQTRFHHYGAPPAPPAPSHANRRGPWG